MKSKFYQTFVILLLVFLSACSNELVYNNIARINYGTSFGECVGYCRRDVTVKSVQVTYSCSSWYPAISTVTTTSKINKSLADSIKSIHPDSFFKLPEFIGCPDCADGGAEWLELELVSGEIHKVTFEYYKEPDLLKNYIENLRKLLSKNECK